MEIEKIHNFLDSELSDISRAELPQHSHLCPHCGLQVRYPTIAREQDVMDFRLIMESAEYVMEKYGITANLLAEIGARCHIALAQRKSKEGGPEPND